MGGGKGIAALDEPAEGEEGNPRQNSGAPRVGVPPAVLPDGELPLLPEGHRVRVHGVGRVRVPDVVAREFGRSGPFGSRWGRVARIAGRCVVFGHGEGVPGVRLERSLVFFGLQQGTEGRTKRTAFVP